MSLIGKPAPAWSAADDSDHEIDQVEVTVWATAPPAGRQPTTPEYLNGRG